MEFVGETCADRKKEAQMQAEKIQAAITIADVLMPWAGDEQLDILVTAKGLLHRCTPWSVLNDDGLKELLGR